MVRVTAEEFERMVEQALRRLPDDFRHRLVNVAVLVEREPPHPGLLGYYHGTPLTERSVADPFRMPDRILIFQAPHERAARSLTHLQRLVEDTVWHEVAHYFGMDEGEVRKWEARRRGRLARRRRRRGWNGSAPGGEPATPA